jgi:hypothetical protein
VGSHGPFSSPPRHQPDLGQWWRASGCGSWVPVLIGPRGGSSVGDGPQRGSDPLELPSRELPQLGGGGSSTMAWRSSSRAPAA